MVEVGFLTLVLSLLHLGQARRVVDCHYSDWSSCSYYCGEPPVEKRYETLVEAIPKELRAMCPLNTEAKCGTIACTEPFVFGDWKATDLCTETCGEGKLLEQRTCTPTHPDKSCASLPTLKTLKPGSETCEREPCKGESTTSATTTTGLDPLLDLVDQWERKQLPRPLAWILCLLFSSASSWSAAEGAPISLHSSRACEKAVGGLPIARWEPKELLLVFFPFI